MTNRKLLWSLLCVVGLLAETVPGQEHHRTTPADAISTLRGLTRAAEAVGCPADDSYDPGDYSFAQSISQRVVDRMGVIYDPYTGTHFRSIDETAIDHIVALREAHYSGLCGASPETKIRFSSDIRNVALATPAVIRHEKGDRDAGEWLPHLNRCWFADRVILVRDAYNLTIDEAEFGALLNILERCDNLNLLVRPAEQSTDTVTINWLIAACTAIVVIMFLQHLAITAQNDTPERWTETLNSYRRHLNVARFAWFLLPVPVIILIIDYTPHAQLNVLDQVDDAMSRTGLVTVLTITFFSSVLRLFVERTIAGRDWICNIKHLFQSFVAPHKLRKSSLTEDASAAVINPRPDAWLIWLGFSLAFTVFQYLLDLELLGSRRAHVINTEHPDLLLVVVGALATLIVFMGYFCWIYATLFVLLTEKHHFTSRVTRLFLGDFRNNELPEQALLIGPVLAGKTTFHTGTPSVDASIRPRETYKIVRKGKHTVCLYLIDMPGEDMGDHLFLASLIRADALVLILRIEWLDLKALLDSSNFELDSWHNLIKDSDTQEIRNVRSYIRGLYFATKSTVFEGDQLFRVRSFVLFLNCPYSVDADRVSDLVPVVESWNDFQRLSALIGDRFGVAAGANSCFVVGNAAYTEQGIDVLFQAPSARSRNSLQILGDVHELSAVVRRVYEGRL